MKKQYYIILLILSFACSDNEKIIELKNGIEKDFLIAALERTKYNIQYNGDYFNIEYPNGDIPKKYGVCTDVIIRSYRKINIDLQQLIHEDITKKYNDYPLQRIWNQNNADSNIDHRRVPNLEVFFSKYGKSIPVSNNPNDYKPGDIVTWDLPGSSPWHIGIVSDKISLISNNPLIIHNIGRGPEESDMIFDFPIRGHYRYFVEK
tara:strand:+ start:1021 stop:1635 length:615 start_codon:yes stop_codon:yes gene_type:complete